jgi:hypothetical protein
MCFNAIWRAKLDSFSLSPPPPLRAASSNWDSKRDSEDATAATASASLGKLDATGCELKAVSLSAHEEGSEFLSLESTRFMTSPFELKKKKPLDHFCSRIFVGLSVRPPSRQLLKIKNKNKNNKH